MEDVSGFYMENVKASRGKVVFAKKPIKGIITAEVQDRITGISYVGKYKIIGLNAHLMNSEIDGGVSVYDYLYNIGGLANVNNS